LSGFSPFGAVPMTTSTFSQSSSTELERPWPFVSLALDSRSSRLALVCQRMNHPAMRKAKGHRRSVRTSVKRRYAGGIILRASYPPHLEVTRFQGGKRYTAWHFDAGNEGSG